MLEKNTKITTNLAEETNEGKNKWKSEETKERFYHIDQVARL